MKWLNAILIFLGLIALVLVLLVATQALIAKLKMDAVMDRIEDASLPTTWDEFVATFPDHEEQIAARPRFIAAMDAVCGNSEVSNDQLDLLPIEGNAELPELDAEFPPEMLAALDARMAGLGPRFDELHEALQADPFWGKVDKPASSLSWMDPSYSLAALRQSTRLLVMSAVRHVEHGEGDEAAETVTDGLRLSLVAHRGGSLIDGLVRLACEGMPVRCLEYVLARTDPSMDRLAALDGVLSEYPPPQTAVIGELVHALETGPEMLAMSRSDIWDWIDGGTSARWRAALALVDKTSWLGLNQAYGLEYTVDTIEAWELPWDEFEARHDAAADAVPPWCQIAASSSGYLGLYRGRALRGEGEWRCARIAVAIERYARDHGTLPPRLDDLVPGYLTEVPTEPFHGDPIDYTTDGATGRLEFPIPAGVPAHPFTFDLLAAPPDTISGD